MPGRNEPCHCGSGKKYKHCCLRADEARARSARPAPAANDASREDFEGLSPAQVHEILQARKTKRLTLLNHNASLSPEDAETAPLVAVIGWLLRYHADHGGGTRLTDRANYPRALCRAYLARFDSSYQEGVSVPNEQSLAMLCRAHDLVVACGWTHESYRRSELTTEGVQMLREGKAVDVFRQVFEARLMDLDWTDYLAEEFAGAIPHLEFVQESAAFSLYLLHRHPEGTVLQLFDRFARAFPEFLKPARDDQEVIDWLCGVYLHLFLFEFCKPLGLVKISEGDASSEAASEAASSSEPAGADALPATRYATTGLFEDAFVWP